MFAHYIAPFLPSPPPPQVTKKALRAEFSEGWIAYSHTEYQGAWKMLSSDAVTKALAGVLARLSGKKANL